MRWFLVSSVVLVLGCPMFVPQPLGVGSGGGVFCTEVFVFGVTLTLTDAAGDPVTGATATLTSGTFSEIMQELSPGVYSGAGERAGTYTMLIEANGFASQTVADIVVDENECHVIPVMRQVTLAPAG